MYINTKQKISILLGIILIAISFLFPPCNYGIADKTIFIGYEAFSFFKNNNYTLNVPIFYAQIITILIIIIGLILIFNNKNQN